MSVNITAVLKEGLRRMVQRNGLLLFGIVLALNIVSTLVQIAVGPTSLLLAGIISLVIALASIVVSIAAVRVFVNEETDRLPREYFTRNIGWVFINFLVGGIIIAIVLTIGFVLLVIPGLFLLVALIFWQIYVAVEDESFIAGFQKSWALTSGHRINLFATGVVVFLALIVAGIVLGIVGGLVGGIGGAVLATSLDTSPAQAGGSFGSALGGAFGGTFSALFFLATLAEAYNQLRALDVEENTSPV